MNIRLNSDFQFLLGQTSVLVDKYESNDPTFTESLRLWLDNGEKLLAMYRKPQVSELAALRGMVAAAKNGLYDPSFAVDTKLPKKKATAAIAVFSMNRAQEILQVILKPIFEKLEEAHALTKQIIAIADQTGVLRQYHESAGGVDNIKKLWETLVSKENLRTGLNRILTLVSYSDALHILGVTMKERENATPVKEVKQVNPSEK